MSWTEDQLFAMGKHNTIAQLKSVLSFFDVKLPVTAQRKAVYLDMLFDLQDKKMNQVYESEEEEQFEDVQQVGEEEEEEEEEEEDVDDVDKDQMSVEKIKLSFPIDHGPTAASIFVDWSVFLTGVLFVWIVLTVNFNMLFGEQGTNAL